MPRTRVSTWGRRLWEGQNQTQNGEHWANLGWATGWQRELRQPLSKRGAGRGESWNTVTLSSCLSVPFSPDVRLFPTCGQVQGDRWSVLLDELWGARRGALSQLRWESAPI